MRRALVLPCLLILACVENAERIVVHPDGSLEVWMSAKGGPNDLVDGHPLPLAGRWRALDDTTLAWVRDIGPDTGSAASRANLQAHPFSGDDELQLAVSAHFASASDLPRFIAPESEPYRSAHLERDTRLSIEPKGARTVYTFERTFGARRWSDWNVLSELDEQLPEDARAAIDKEEPLSDAQWLVVTSIVQERYRGSAAAFASDALVSTYTDGDASLPTASLAAALAEVDREIVELISEPRLRQIYAAVTDPEFDELAPELNPDLLVRDALRRSLARALDSASVPRETHYAVIERLEWSFTAFDQTTDLGDESFEFEVEMPGTVVLGNYDELDGSTARWEFKGELLHDAPRVLRVVSVVE